MMLARALGGATILGFLAHSALAQAVAEQEQEFAQKAAEGGLIEVQLGELAQQQAKDEQVILFGERMVQDHGRANEKLMQQLLGAEFDEAYMDEMVEDHEKDVELFEQQAESGKDPDLRAFAEETLPTLREHKELAKQVQSQITAVGGDGVEPKHAARLGRADPAG